MKAKKVEDEKGQGEKERGFGRGEICAVKTRGKIQGNGGG